jgi:hypothetical protein
MGPALPEWEADFIDDYTPNYVSDIHLTDIGPTFYFDTKGELAAPMAGQCSTS